MRVMNESMQRRLEKISESPFLSSGLNELIQNGFICARGFIFWKSLFRDGALPNEDFIKKHYLDASGYESAVNKIHIEDYCEDETLENALAFLNVFENKWKASFKERCVAIIGIDDGEFGLSCSFRFHVRRDSEKWIDVKNINALSDPILISEI